MIDYADAVSFLITALALGLVVGMFAHLTKGRG